MSREPSIRLPRRGNAGRLRTTVVGAVAVLSLGLSGCGEPDDDGGDGGGTGYLAQQLTGSMTAPENR
ncbi:MAG: hypothetical protein M3Q22_17450 [Actinomycetota bacterium]|nr:hypothetical protein [Actinomycetota bacterium]